MNRSFRRSSRHCRRPNPQKMPSKTTKSKRSETTKSKRSETTKSKRSETTKSKRSETDQQIQHKILNMNNNSPPMSNQSGSKMIKNLKRPPLDKLSGESKKKNKKIKNNVEKSCSSETTTSINHTSTNLNMTVTSSFENDECESSNSNNINNTAIKSKKKIKIVQDDKHLNREGEKKNLKNGSSCEKNQENKFDMPSTRVPEVKIGNDFLEGLKNGNEYSIQTFLSIVLKVLTQKDNIHDQFDSIMNQKLCEYLTEKSDIGGKLADLKLLIEKGEMWKTKYLVLSQQIKGLTRVVQAQQAILRKNHYSKPVTRTVALQANCKPKEDDERSNIRTPVKPTTVNSATSSLDPLIPEPVIISDDDDEVIQLEDLDEFIKPSTSNSEIIEKISPNQKLPSPINKQATALLTKEVPPSVPIVSDTIDLTGNDDTLNDENEVSTKAKNLPSAVIPAKNVTYVEIPSTSSPGFIVGNSLNSATPTVRPAQLSTVTNLSMLNSRNQQTFKTPLVFKNGQLIPVQLAPMVTTPQQIQPRAISAFIRQPAPSLAPLQHVPPGITLVTQHPAPTPSAIQRHCSSWKKLPPAPELTVSRANREDHQGLVLSWTINNLSDAFAEITFYQIYAYHEIATDIPKTETWKKIGDVNALPLPMACTLTQFISGEKYHFAVRAVDVHKRFGPFSTPKCQFMV